jgi:hypothetical protein
VIVASKLLDGERLIEIREELLSTESDVLSYRGTENTDATPKGQYMPSTSNSLAWTSAVNLTNSDIQDDPTSRRLA